MNEERKNYPAIVEIFIDIAKITPDATPDIAAALIKAFASGIDFGRAWTKESSEHYRQIAGEIEREGIETE